MSRGSLGWFSSIKGASEHHRHPALSHRDTQLRFNPKIVIVRPRDLETSQFNAETSNFTYKHLPALAVRIMSNQYYPGCVALHMVCSRFMIFVLLLPTPLDMHVKTCFSNSSLC